MENPVKLVSKGFTMMELMVAMVIIGSIMTMIMSGFWQFSDQNSRVESILKLRQEMRILEKLIREDLQAAVYLEEFMGGGEKDDVDDGRKSGIYGINETRGDKDADIIHLHVNRSSRFYRSTEYKNDPMLHEVSYFLIENDDDALKFQRREEFYLDPDITDGERSIIHTLSNHVVSFNIQYYRINQDEALDEWDSSNTDQQDSSKNQKGNWIPAGVKVTLEIMDKKGEKLVNVFQVNIHPPMSSNINWYLKEK